MGKSVRRSLTCLFVAVLAVPPTIANGGLAAAETIGSAFAKPQRAIESAALTLDWFRIAGPYLAAPPQVLPPDDLLFPLGVDGSAYTHVRENGGWSDPIALGGLFDSVVVPALALDPLPFVEAFGVGLDGAMWYGVEGTPGWRSLGGLFIFDPLAVTVQEGGGV